MPGKYKVYRAMVRWWKAAGPELEPCGYDDWTHNGKSWEEVLILLLSLAYQLQE